MEELKKNFILLSKIAKEKKYAQEYLGLLARRGDIGSIRIGKRWYTTAEWFSEFLRDAEIRKEEMKRANNFLAKPAEEDIKKIEINRTEEAAIPEKIFSRQAETVKISEKHQEKPKSEEEKVSLKIVSPVQKEPIQREDKIASLESEEVKIILPKVIKADPVAPKYFVPEKELGTINLRMKRNVKPMLRKVAPNASKLKINVPKKEIRLQTPGNSENIQKWKTKPEELSPNFAPTFSRTGFFPKFAFATSGVLLLVMLVGIGWVYRNEIKNMAGGIESGIVAGAQDSRINIDAVRNSSASYLGSQEEKIRENLSFSRVLIKAALERDNEQGSVSNDH
jgi:hypothetical protein